MAGGMGLCDLKYGPLTLCKASTVELLLPFLLRASAEAHSRSNHTSLPPPAPLWPLAQLPGSAGKGLLIHHRGNAAGLPPRRLGLRVKQLRLLRQGRIKDSYFAHPHTNPPTLYVFDHFSPAPRLIRRDHPPPHPTSLHIRIMWRESEGCGCKEAALSPFLSHCV